MKDGVFLVPRHVHQKAVIKENWAMGNVQFQRTISWVNAGTVHNSTSRPLSSISLND